MYLGVSLVEVLPRDGAVLVEDGGNVFALCRVLETRDLQQCAFRDPIQEILHAQQTTRLERIEDLFAMENAISHMQIGMTTHRAQPQPYLPVAKPYTRVLTSRNKVHLVSRVDEVPSSM